MRIRKILKFVCPVLAILLLTGCGNVKDIISNIADNASEAVSDYNEKNKYKSPHEYAVDTFNEVLKLIQKKDSQAIFDLFNEDARINVDLMPQIEKLVNFMDGEIAEIGHVGASNAYGTVRDGVTVSAAYTATADVTNDEGVLYWVKVDVITANEDETKLGLDWIYILDCDAKTAFRNEWRNWYDNDGDKSTEPQMPESMDIGVNYFKSQK